MKRQTSGTFQNYPDEPQSEPVNQTLTINGLTEADISTLIQACKIAQRSHDQLTQHNGHLMERGEVVAHLNKASKFSDLSKKLQSI